MDRNFEQEYKKAFEAAKGLHDAGNALTKKQMEIVFPQLAESEDERIRKFLIEMFSHGSWRKEWPFGPNEIVAWLEKQKEPHYTKRNALFDKCVENCDPEIMKKVSDEVDAKLEREQKPAEPSDDELQRHQDELYDFKVFAAKQAREHHISFIHDFEWNNFCDELLSYFNEKQKPAEWSEEDERRRDGIIQWLREYQKKFNPEYDSLSIESIESLIDWLKSLRPQPHWKPSEEQMRALLKVVDKARELHYSSNSGYDEYDVLRSLYKQLKEL